MPRISLPAILLLPGLAIVGACVDEPAPIDEECGELPVDGCLVDACDSSAGLECSLGDTLYECVGATWEAVGECDPARIVVDGTWTLQLAGTLDEGCPEVELPPELTIEAAHPEGTQELTLSALDAAFEEVDLLVKFDSASADFEYHATWSDVPTTSELDIELWHDGQITGTARTHLAAGELGCTVTLDVTGSFTPGWYEP